MLENIDVIILAAGFGTRIRSLFQDRPKVLVPIGQKVFLDFVVEKLIAAGFRSFIFSVGYKADMVKDHVLQTYSKTNPDIKITFSELTEEEVTLGTGLSLSRALTFSKQQTVFAVNGDTLCALDFKSFYTFHKDHEGVLSMALIEAARKDAGAVSISNNGQIEIFDPESKTAHPYINAGHYFIEREKFQKYLPAEKRFSLEHDLFPKLAEEKGMYGFVTDSPVIDIGTPERYQKFIETIGI